MTSILSLFNRTPAPTGAFAGKTVVFTGALKHGGYAMERKEDQWKSQGWREMIRDDELIFEEYQEEDEDDE